MSEESKKLEKLSSRTSPTDKQTFLSYLMGMNVKYYQKETLQGNPNIENPLLFNPRTARRKSEGRYGAPRVRNAYNHFAIVDSAEPAKVINRLNITDETESFLKIPSPLISSIRHYVRFYEIVEEEGYNDKFLVPVPFPTVPYGSVQMKAMGGKFAGQLITINRSKYGMAQAGRYDNKRLADYGLEEIMLDFQATNPAEINNNIICKMKIFFNAVQGLSQYQVLDVPPSMAGVGEFDPRKWNFMRLLTRGPNHTSKAKLVIGFDQASLTDLPAFDANSFNAKIVKDLRKFMMHETLTINLSLKEHEIDVNENGSVSLTITYHGGIASELSDSEKSNIFGGAVRETDSAGNLSKKTTREYLRFIEQRLSELRAIKNNKNRDQGVGPSANQPPPGDTKEQSPDYSREYLENKQFKFQRRAFSRVTDLFTRDTGDAKEGSNLAISKWLDEDPALAEERGLIRRRNEIMFKEQQALGEVFFDYLINDGLIRDLYIPIEAFHKTLASRGSEKQGIPENDPCNDFQRILPFVSVQASGGPIQYKDELGLRKQFRSPIENPDRIGFKLGNLDSNNKPYKYDDILKNPPFSTETEILANLMQTTFNYGNRGLSKDLQDLNTATQKISKDLFAADDALNNIQVSTGRQYPNNQLKDNLLASLKKARNGKQDLKQKNLLRIQYVFLGDIIEGILAYHALGQRIAIGDGKFNLDLDLQKKLILNNFELNDAGLCSDNIANTRAYWKNTDASPNGVASPLKKAEKKQKGVREARIQRAKVRNIADIPIAIETLSTWWITNVVKKLRTTWTIGEFLNSVMTQLIPAGIGLNSTRGNLVPKPTRSQVPSLNIFELSLSAETLFETNLIKNRNNRATYMRDIAEDNFFANVLESGTDRFDDNQTLSNVITDQDLRLLKKAKTPSRYSMYGAEPQGHWESKGMVDDAVTCMVMSILPVERSDLKGDEKSDTEAGVWHFRLARDGGPVLSYSFSRNEIPYLSEANIFNSSNATANDTSSGISYNITLKMIGNQILQPGSTMFVDLLGLGFGSSTNQNSLSYGLNIGGYYVVNTVKSYFNVEGYFTEVQAVWQQTVVE